MSKTHRPVTLAELEHVHETLAILAAGDRVYLPTFASLEAALIVARAQDDPVAKARAMLAAQRAVA